MKEYKGITPSDRPMNGGSYVTDTLNAWEKFNFYPVRDESEAEVCYGFVETKHIQRGLGERKKLHIENIVGCETMSKAPFVDDVLVVWCATNENGDLRVVGWYKHARVYRCYQKFPEHVQIEFNDKDRTAKSLVYCVSNLEPINVGGYFIKTEARNAFLLSEQERNNEWKCYSAKKDGVGFGQSLIWYGKIARTDRQLAPQAEDIIEKINTYNPLTKLVGETEISSKSTFDTQGALPLDSHKCCIEDDSHSQHGSLTSVGNLDKRDCLVSLVRLIQQRIYEINKSRREILNCLQSYELYDGSILLVEKAVMNPHEKVMLKVFKDGKYSDSWYEYVRYDKEHMLEFNCIFGGVKHDDRPYRYFGFRDAYYVLDDSVTMPIIENDSIEQSNQFVDTQVRKEFVATVNDGLSHSQKAKIEETLPIVSVDETKLGHENVETNSGNSTIFSKVKRWCKEKRRIMGSEELRPHYFFSWTITGLTFSRIKKKTSFLDLLLGIVLIGQLYYNLFLLFRYYYRVFIKYDTYEDMLKQTEKEAIEKQIRMVQQAEENKDLERIYFDSKTTICIKKYIQKPSLYVEYFVYSGKFFPEYKRSAVRTDGNRKYILFKETRVYLNTSKIET